MKNEWWIVVDKDGHPCSVRDSEERAEARRKYLNRVCQNDAPHRAVRVVPADEVEALKREVRYLRHYGNKDCTAMADAAMADAALEPKA